MHDTWRRLLRSTLSREDSEYGEVDNGSGASGEDAGVELDEPALSDNEATRYIENRLAGKAPDDALPELATFFAQHPQVRAELEELVAIFAADINAPQIEPVTAPAYTLSFLKTPAQPAAAERAPAPNPFPPSGVTAITSGLNWLVDQMGQFWFDIGRAGDRFTPAQALVTRGGTPSDDPARTGEQTIRRMAWTPDELGDLDLEVKAFGDLNAERCTLQITVRVPTRWPTQDGVAVTILYREPISELTSSNLTKEVERSAITDEDGVVTFDNFSVKAWPGIVIRVTLHPQSE